jgi:lipopolysaccharide transport system ATP-binding protein
MNFDKEPLVCLRKTNRFRFSIDNPGLVLGEYSLIIYVYDIKGRVVFWGKNMARFQIANRENNYLTSIKIKSPIIPSVEISQSNNSNENWKICL